jgi:ElaA protein
MTAAYRATDGKIDWTWRSFDQLSPRQLYTIVALRETIFIVEQNAPQLDADGRDPPAMHLLGIMGDQLIAYLRVLPVNLYEPGVVSFGRVVVRKEYRGLGLGHDLVGRAMRYLDDVRNGAPIKISSQLYLQKFYEGYGFRTIREPHIEDHVWHVAMKRD